MILLRHFLRYLQTTRRRFRIILLVLLISCSTKPAEQAGGDSTAVETPDLEQQLFEKKPDVRPPSNGEWDRKLNYVLDIPKGSVNSKNIVVVIAVDNEPQSAHYVVTGIGHDNPDAVTFIISQPIVALMLDTAVVYGEGLQQAELCFDRAIWYNIEFEDKAGQTYSGWIPDTYGVYSVDQTEIGGRAYNFEGIPDALWLGSMHEMEVDLRFVKKDYDPTAADNCRDLNPLFFYNDKKIYMIGGELDEQWFEPGFNTSLSHLSLVRSTANDLVITPDASSVGLSLTSNKTANVMVKAQDGRLTVN